MCPEAIHDTMTDDTAAGSEGNCAFGMFGSSRGTVMDEYNEGLMCLCS